MWAAFGAIWALNEKVAFDGPAKQIRVNVDATLIDVKTDLYSAWKRWAQLDDHAKFLPAFRTIGGDPVGGGLFAGDIYFLVNGWQIVIDHQVQVVGTLYHDDGIPVYVLEALGGVTAQVSNLAYSVSTPVAEVEVPTPAEISAAVWAAAQRTLTASSDPTVAQIVAAILAAAQATPIHSDLRKVNDYPITGEGTEATPWGPA